MSEQILTESAETPDNQVHHPAPLLKRMIAFAMDFILIVLLLQLLAHFMPNFWGENTKEEFQQLLQQVYQT